MPSATQLCFAFFLASFTCTRAEGSTREYNGNTLRDDNGSSNQTTCSWNCTVIHSDFPDQRKTTFVKNRLIKLVVEYEKKVNQKCAKRSSRTSSENATEYLKVWLPANNKLSSFDNVIQTLLNWGFLLTPKNALKLKRFVTFGHLAETSRKVHGRPSQLVTLVFGLDSVAVVLKRMVLRLRKLLSH